MPSAEEEITAGEVALGRLDYEAAFKHFDKATKLDAKNPVAYFGKAESALGIATVGADDILGWYRKAIELDPNNPQFHEALASQCMDLGRFNEAEQAYTKAAELDRDNAPFYYTEFAIHYRNKAPVIMEQFLDDKTRDMIAQKALSYALKALNMDREEAKRLL
ncbi:MAG: tetratricopeptide repeat protein [Euryarchaeota archaeon]|nr:tetratricopeptide repeat protein [Euryarchaeota archaeon]